MAKKLSALGFEKDEISSALGWLTGLTKTTDEMSILEVKQTAFSFGFRVYANKEFDLLGTEIIGFIQFLESANIINTLQREIVIERACAIKDFPVSLEKLKIIVLLVLWSQGKDPDSLIFDELFISDDDEFGELLLH